MNLYEGLIIWTFPDTDIRAYKRVIEESGFRAIVEKDFIRVGKPYLPNKIDYAKFGKLLTTKRREKNITRQDLSLKLGVSQDTIFEWEIGRRFPKEENMEKLKQLLGITKGDMECLIKKQ